MPDKYALTALYFGVIASNGVPNTLDDAWKKAEHLADYALSKLKGDTYGQGASAPVRLR